MAGAEDALTEDPAGGDPVDELGRQQQVVDAVARALRAERPRKAAVGKARVGADVLQRRASKQRREVLGLRRVVEVTQDDEVGMLGQALQGDLLDARGLAQPLRVTAAALALEVLTSTGISLPAAVRTRYSGQSRLKIGRLGANRSKTWLRNASNSRPSLVNRPTLMPRSSLPSISIVCS